MQKYIALFLLLMAAWGVQAQQPVVTCWDFEESCPQPNNAFLSGCITDAIATSGSPGNESNSISAVAPSNLRYATMRLRKCGNDSQPHGDGIALEHSFTSGRRYRVRFKYFIESTHNPVGDNPFMGFHLVNDLANNGGSGTCDNDDIIPGIPQTAQTLGAVNRSSAPILFWNQKTLEFTAQSNFSHIWFRPFLDEDIAMANMSFRAQFHLDNVCIEDITCVADPVSFEVCQHEGGWVEVTLNNEVPGGSISQDEFILTRDTDCKLNIEPVYEPQLILWKDHNTFMLPLNSGCYELTYLLNRPGCPVIRIATFRFQTKAGSLPTCNFNTCIDWNIDVQQLFCSKNTFTVVPDDPFPAGTIIQSSVNDQPYVNNPEGLVAYYPVNEGDNQWVKVCFRVVQPGCDPVGQCEYIYVTNCEGFSGGGTDVRNNGVALESDQQVLRFTNPADQFIRFSTPFAEGTAQLFSMQGSLLKSFVLNGTQQLDVSDVPDGQYTLSIQQADGRQAKLVLIMHR
ncbi:MAG: T9SS type A sorting domain-containing protein [Chitinophagales bacterium]|nr:T9SS type A sorting domain-containing protein [Chitinophagales bacterium]